MSGKILPFRRPAAPPEKLPAGLSDEALLLACGAGDSAALGELYERFHAVVYRVLSRLVGTTCAELDDLVQATFIEVMRAAIHFQRRSSVRSYILGIASNLARHHHRSQQRRLAQVSGPRRSRSQQAFDTPWARLPALGAALGL